MLLVASVLVVLSREDGESPDVAGGGPFRLAPAWDVEVNGLPVAYHSDTGTVLLWASDPELEPQGPHFLSARDVRTGELKWRSGPEGWDVSIDYLRGGKLSTSAVIVQSNPNRGAPGIAALRVTDGAVLWQVETPGQFSRPTAVAADALAVVWNDTTVRGMSASDGRTLWQSAAPAGCTADEVAADGDLAAIEYVCGDRRHVHLVGATTGQVLWQRDVWNLGEVTSDNLRVQGDAVLIRNAERLQVLNRSGAVLFEQTSRDIGDVRFVADANLAVVSHRDQAKHDLLTAVDLNSGAVRWQQPLAVASLVRSRTAVYALSRLEPLLPIGLAAIVPANGRHSVAMTHLIGADYDSLVALDDGFVVTYFWVGRQAHLAGHRMQPQTAPMGAAGGAPDEEWPDGCSVLDPAELTVAVTTVTYTARRDDGHVSCQYRPSSVSAPVITAGVAWVGVDTEQSVQLMDRLTRSREATALPGIGDQALEVIEEGENERKVQVYFRVGRRIGLVSLPDDTERARALARSGAARLG
ncbi:PQQ-binding-like beta-propeller repeat protein [Micromonospora sp. CA-259024]|uniref:outer membrane protein assembly factor BamB family protein n=1 Tax=Micromonospora sp. CA-259024 TaxID=3239965 RepID=UPI003D907D80